MKVPQILEVYRVLRGPWGSKRGDDYGAYADVPGPEGERLRIIVSPGDADPEVPWEHVSVSIKRRDPHWREMSWVKDLFWDPEVTVMQLHPPRSEYINNHAHCLHLWRPMHAEIPLPPSVAVGYKELNLVR